MTADGAGAVESDALHAASPTRVTERVMRRLRFIGAVLVVLVKGGKNVRLAIALRLYSKRQCAFTAAARLARLWFGHTDADLAQHGSNDVRSASTAADLSGRGVQIALAGVAEGTARGEVERAGDAIGAPVAILEQMCGDDESSPRDEPLRRRIAGTGKSLRNRTARERQQARQLLRR
jgi:hypothetical protein